MDEYLILNHYYNIQQIIEKYSPFDEITINWLLFGNSNVKESNRNTMFDVFVNSDNKLNVHVKSFLKVDSIIAANNPHRVFTKRSSIYKNIYNEVIDNYYTNMYDDKFKGRDDGVNFFSKLSNEKLMYSNNVPMYLAHFIINDTFNFYRRRYYNYGSSRRYEIKRNYVNQNFTNEDIQLLLNDKSQEIIDMLHSNDDGKIALLIEKHYNDKNDSYKASIRNILLNVINFYRGHNCNLMPNSVGEKFIQLNIDTLYKNRFVH